MKLRQLILSAILLAGFASQAYALVLTFDDIPQGNSGLQYYTYAYGVAFGYHDFTVVDHTNSPWGLPHSSPNVLVKGPEMPDTATEMYVYFKGGAGQQRAYSFGMYLSTEYGAALEMIGYNGSYSHVVASALIGGTDQAWNNVYAEVNSASGEITGVILRALTPSALAHFCADDATIEFVPEPSSLAALGFAIAGLAMAAARRKRR